MSLENVTTGDYDDAFYLSNQVEQAKRRAVLAASDAGVARDRAASAEQSANEAAKRAERANATIGVDATEARQAASEAISAKTDAKESATQAYESATIASGVAGIAGNLSNRLTGVESMAGIGPSTPVDGQTANLIEQPDSLTRIAVSEAISRVAVTPRPINIIQAGADPTGAADSSQVWRTAFVTGAPIETGRGGTFLVSRHGANPWALAPQAGQKISGSGTIKLAPGTAPFVSIIQPMGNDFQISGVTLDGNKANQSVEAQHQRHGIFLDNVSRPELDSVKLINMAGDGILTWRKVDGLRARHVSVNNSQRNGVSLTGSGANFRFFDLTVEGVAAQAFDIEADNAGLTISDVEVLASTLAVSGTDYAVDISNTGGSLLDGIRFVGSLIKGPMHIANSNGVTILDSTVDARGSGKHAVSSVFTNTNFSTLHSRIFVDGTRDGIRSEFTTGYEVDHVNIRDTRIETGSGPAVRLAGQKHVSIIDNRAYGAGGAWSAFNFAATRAARLLRFRGNRATGFSRCVYVADPNVIDRVETLDNYLSDEIAGGLYAVHLAGNASSYPDVYSTGNFGAGAILDTFSPPIWTQVGSGIYRGVGSPEGVLVGGIGNMALRADAAASNLYVKTTATGSNGWVAK